MIEVGSLILLVFLILLSAFFSGSETGMMALNRYRLRHLARKKDRSAIRVNQLLARTDRLLGVILIGNTFANVLASALATFLALRWFGDIGVLFATVTLTVIILIFAEITPKTLAATYPDQIAFKAALPLKLLLRLLYPFVWLVNGAGNGLLKLFGVKSKHGAIEALNKEELRTVVHESTTMIPSRHQQMLLGILDLDQVMVDDVMIPRGEVTGIDLTIAWDDILVQISESRHDYIPVYHESLDNFRGLLHLRKVFLLVSKNQLNEQTLLETLEQPYFIPEGTSLNRQLINFRQARLRVGLVVDEYGDILGLLTLEDILEEIIGEFPGELALVEHPIKKMAGNAYLVTGNITIRELNRALKLKLPVDGPKTISGLIIEVLEIIPKSGVGLKIAGVPIEVVKVKNNAIREVKISVK